MQCMAFHQFAPSSSLPIWSRVNNRFTPKTSIITSISKPKSKPKSNLKSRSRSSTCYPIQCTVVDNPSSTITNNSDRRSANYGPPIWSFDFIQSLPTQYKGEPYTSRLNKLEKDVKKMLIGVENSLAKLELIDTIQRLGLSYHFENEIISILKEKFTNNNNNPNPNYDLYATALQFRLLRHYGFEVPQEIFNVFKDKSTGKFKESISDDIKGALSLYEASFYEKKGESILEEAKVFTTKCLKKYVEHNKLLDVDNTMTLFVRHALETPVYWRINRLEARWFIGMYEKKQDMNSTLLEFAKLDFNMVQSIHQEDLKHFARWWEDSKLGEEKMNDHVRYRTMECFLWQVGVRFEPKYSNFRRISARLYMLITVIDDIYDVYGTLEELNLFTKAVERWDVNATNELPEYMRMPFFFLFNTINEMAYGLLADKNFNNIEYLKNSWVALAKYQLEEAKWFYSGYKPTLQEYIKNTWISVGGPIILLHAYFALTNPLTKESLKCLEEAGYDPSINIYKGSLNEPEEGYPTIIHLGAMLLRLEDDLGTASDEMKRGDVPKSIQCHMHDKGVSEDEARDHIKFLVMETWKEMNKQNEYKNAHFSKEFVQVCKDLGRTAHFTYLYDDGHASQSNITKERILELIVNPIPM